MYFVFKHKQDEKYIVYEANKTVEQSDEQKDFEFFASSKDLDLINFYLQNKGVPAANVLWYGFKENDF